MGRTPCSASLRRMADPDPCSSVSLGRRGHRKGCMEPSAVFVRFLTARGKNASHNRVLKTVSRFPFCPQTPAAFPSGELLGGKRRAQPLFQAREGRGRHTCVRCIEEAHASSQDPPRACSRRAETPAVHRWAARRRALLEPAGLSRKLPRSCSGSTRPRREAGLFPSLGSSSLFSPRSRLL